MAHGHTPRFHNNNGIARIAVGAREFLCMGALPPHDHPHVYLDMGSELEIVCPYCSTHYVFEKNLPHGGADPADARYDAA